jgi:CheY-like chemotaxis protein
MDEHMSSTDESSQAQQIPPGSSQIPPGSSQEPPGSSQDPHGSSQDQPREKAMKVLVYSHDGGTRAAIRIAIGRRPAPDVPPAELIECATEPGLFSHLDAGGIDIMVLDGEAQPAGGMGVCRQAKDEIYNCPPVLLVIGRVDDGWLATWSGADSVVSHPIDPPALAAALAGLMRHRAALTQA